MKLLVIGAHLDDSVIAVGGTIRKLVKAGGQVDVVCFGNSDEDFSDVADEATASERIKAQARRAHDILGVSSFTCFDYSDYAVQENRESYRLCIQSIRKYQPDLLFSHYWAEYFQHRAMARLACDAWWQAGWSCSADLGEPWMTPSLYHFEVIHLLPQPTEIVDISETFETKIAAWKCFQSSSEHLEPEKEGADSIKRAYGATLGGSLTEQIETRARYYGSLIGVRYGEALKKSDYLPRPIHDLSVL
jgi:LmbE family N-acetylglucosaminyl deacetylase